MPDPNDPRTQDNQGGSKKPGIPQPSKDTKRVRGLEDQAGLSDDPGMADREPEDQVGLSDDDEEDSVEGERKPG